MNKYNTSYILNNDEEHKKQNMVSLIKCLQFYLWTQEF